MKQYLMRLMFIVILVPLYFLFMARFDAIQDRLDRGKTFTLHFPLPEDIRKQNTLSKKDVPEKVLISGHFSSWSSTDERFRMQRRPGSPPRWSITLRLLAKQNPYQFLLFFPGKHQKYRIVRIHDWRNPNRATHEIVGPVSIYRTRQPEKGRRIAAVIIIGLGVGIILITLLELLLRGLMRLNISLKYKLVIIFAVFLLTTNLFLVFYTDNQRLEGIKQASINEINAIHSFLVSQGTDFSRLTEPETQKKVTALLQAYFAVVNQRFDYQWFSNTQTLIQSIFLFDREDRLCISTGNKDLHGKLAQGFPKASRMYLDRGRRLPFRITKLLDKLQRNRIHLLPAGFMPFSAPHTSLYTFLTGFSLNGFYYPVRADNRFVGYYLIPLIPMAYQMPLQEMFFANLLLAGVLCVLAMLLIKKMGQIVLQPLRKLAGALNRVQAGQMDYRVDIETRDELESLGSAYNYMAQELKTSSAKLEDYARNLEKKVEARTEELKEANKQLQELDRVKSRFFANVSHELRTPLTLILGPLDSLLGEKRLPAKTRLRQYHETMHTNALRLLKMINNLLDFSKLEAGRMEPRFQRINVFRNLEFLVSTLQSAADAKGLTLELETQDKETELYLDLDMFEKIVMNLLSNAFKFTDPGGTIRILLHVTGKKPQQARISIQDTGIGIAQDQQETIFNRFIQAEGSTRSGTQGTGIGLSLVKELVTLQHGEITVQSSPGQGTTFSVVFPLGRAHLGKNEIVEDREASLTTIKEPYLVDVRKQTPVPEEQESEPPTTASGEGENEILVVDDNPDMRIFLRSQLEKHYRVREAANGKLGLRSAQRQAPDLILSDVMMPEMNGYEFCTAVKQSPALKNVPFILLTAKADISQKLEGLEYGADDYLTKPFHPQELRLRINNLLTNRRLQSSLMHEKIQRDLDFDEAATVQKTILTPESAYQALAGLEIHVTYQPMNGSVSGDYYNITPAGKGLASVLLADATGHGTQAALSTMQIDILNRESLALPNPDERLEYINSKFTQEIGSKNYFTCFLADIQRSAIVYACAAHPAQFLLRTAEKQLVPLKSGGKIIGFLDDCAFEQRKEKVTAGDVLVLFSDGITEEFNHKEEEFGEARLITLLQKLLKKGLKNLSMSNLAEKILREVERFRGGHAVNDDITLICIRIK